MIKAFYKKIIEFSKVIYIVYRKAYTLASIIINVVTKGNDFILSSPKRRTNKGYINLHWWSMSRNDNKENLGDYLSIVVYRYLLKVKNLERKQYVGKTKHLYGIGSIIQAGFQSATIWGSGLIRVPSGLVDKIKLTPFLRKLDIRIVRGPETRKILIQNGYNCPEKYGDPAILMPLIYKPKKIGEIKDFVIVFHHATKIFYENSLDIVTTDYKTFLDELCNSKKVISGSLHGIILAESYGIPAILLNDAASQKDIFKFNDYYFSTNRFEYPIANSIEEALKMEPVQLPQNLDIIRKDLINSFPSDLWKI